MVTDYCRSSRRAFSQSSAARADEDDKNATRVRQKKAPTLLRRRMNAWMNGPGRAFANPIPGEPNYLSAYNFDGVLQRAVNRRNKGAEEQEMSEEEAEKGEDVTTGRTNYRDNQSTNLSPRDLRPFPLNTHFKSESVLSEPLKDAIYLRVTTDGRSISAVSAEFKVDMRRVAAVVRLKEVEKNWEKEGKPFADSYAAAILDMLPKTNLKPGNAREHESINDLPVHPATKQQIFYPTSESRQITRQDAARIFSPSLLPADKRVPHPELIEAERVSDESTSQADKDKLAEELRQAAAKAKTAAKERRQAVEAARTTVVKGSRWDFKFESINANSVGRHGRSHAGVGWRYGMPYEDRKRGHVKGVPTAVEV